MTEREGRGRATVRDPAAAIAMAKCWLSTWTRRMEAGGSPTLMPATSTFHPFDCPYCKEPRDLLITMLEEFKDWSEISSHEDEHGLRMEIEAWLTLNPAEQSIKVKRAQGYYEQPVPGVAQRDEQRNPW